MQFPGLFHLLATPHLYLPPHPFSLLCLLIDLSELSLLWMPLPIHPHRQMLWLML